MFTHEAASLKSFLCPHFIVVVFGGLNLKGIFYRKKDLLVLRDSFLNMSTVKDH